MNKCITIKILGKVMIFNPQRDFKSYSISEIKAEYKKGKFGQERSFRNKKY